ncbi:MAG: metalloregulator ArsR/SmtB family transcription factor [Leclercia sp.]
MTSELDSQFFDKASDIAKSLGNGRRMQLLELLSHGEKSVERLAVSLDIGITSVSAHLQILKNAGVVRARKDGVKVFYSIADKGVSLLLDHVKNITAKIGYPETETALHVVSEYSISLHQLINKLDAGNCVLIDVRPKDEYETFHIPGAQSVPVEDVNSWALNFNDAHEVIIYCRGIYCLLSAAAMQTLTARGITCSIYPQGISEWRRAGFPVEGAFA